MNFTICITNCNKDIVILRDMKMFDEVQYFVFMYAF